ncbi:hypothetical protein Q8F55_008762 [Vanrija albida]|uniref:Zn(2)-C6 fungal-type domain-containing protein n=1 Tax=Vanrija albida TaxID=181172 RepID=A0ABR3PRU0_9TREE
MPGATGADSAPAPAPPAGPSRAGSASAPSPSKATAPPKASKTCDNCRKRKIKCVDDDRDATLPCVGCRNLQIDCTYDYVKKKPGRKNSFALAVKAQQAQERDSHNGSRDSVGPVRSSLLSSQRQLHAPYPDQHRQSTARSFSANGLGTTPSGLQGLLDAADAYDSHRTPSASSQNQGTTPRSPFSAFGGGSVLNGGPPLRAHPENGGLSWLDSITLDNFGNGLDFGFNLIDGINQFPSEQAQLLSLESPENMLSNPAASASNNHGSSREPQLEDVTSWANISHYISLYLQYLWPLLPLVHRQTFAEGLATRQDLRDTDFRALLLSLVAFSISQLPTSRLVTDQFDVEGLKRLQRRCHRTSQALQRTYHGSVSLTQICIIIFDNFYLLSIGLAHTAAARLGQAVQLAFTLGLHSDAKTAALGLDSIEVQLRRRVFWQLYASDKTRAIPGNPMLINDFQGVCSFPEAIDDEYITSQGMFPQPPQRTSLLEGFVSVSKLFRILSECFFHHRCILSDLQTIGVEWTVAAEERVHVVLAELPGAIQDPTTVLNEANRQVFATQRANILITAAIVKFALYDLRSALHIDDERLIRDRKAIAREIHSMLMSIPVEDLASNGESVRGKVFHIACALCGQAGSPGTDTDLVRDWCDMFSAITFIQMPPPADATMDSRANSPPPGMSVDTAPSS